MSNENGSFKKKKVYFTQVGNEAIRDKQLSLKAKGLYTLIQSYITIENFILYKSTLKKDCIEGEISFEGAWKELKMAGYLIQYRLQNEKKQFYYIYDLLDQKDIELAEKIHTSQNRKSKEEKAIPHETKGMGKNKKAIPHETDGMGSRCDGEGGVYNNTDFTNTDFTNTDNTNLLVVVEAIQLFEDNICELKKTTKEQLVNYCNKYDIEFIKAIINLCAESGTKYFSGFKTIINGYIGKGIVTKLGLETYVVEYREQSQSLRDKERLKRKNRTNNKTEIFKEKKSSFTDYEQRKYDFDELEKKLLGWK